MFYTKNCLLLKKRGAQFGCYDDVDDDAYFVSLLDGQSHD